MEHAQASRTQPSLTHRAILAIAVPIMISNVSTPLLGVVDARRRASAGRSHRQPGIGTFSQPASGHGPSS